MPIIATKVIVGTIAATTALGGFFVKDDIQQSAQFAIEYIEAKEERISGDMIQTEINRVSKSRFSGQNLDM